MPQEKLSWNKVLWQSKNYRTHSLQENTLDCDQSNYSSHIVFSHTIPIEFGRTGISAIQSAEPENPILEPNASKSDDPPRRYRHLNFPRWRPSKLDLQYKLGVHPVPTYNAVSDIMASVNREVTGTCKREAFAIKLNLEACK